MSKEYQTGTKERVRFLYHEMSRKISKEKSTEEIAEIKKSYKGMIEQVLEKDGKEKKDNNKMDIEA